jgi:hypothetical protein
MRPCRRDGDVALGGYALWMAHERKLRYLGRAPDIARITVCSPDGRWLAIGSASGDVDLYDTANGHSFAMVRDPNAIRFFTFTPDSTQIVIATEDHLILHPVPGCLLAFARVRREALRSERRG